jgi:methyl-accepting chemotaxis protein
MYRFSVSIDKIAALIINLHEQRVDYRQSVIEMADPSRQGQALAELQGKAVEFDVIMAELNASVTTAEGKEYLRVIQDAYNLYAPIREELIMDVRRGYTDDIMALIDRTGEAIKPIVQAAHDFNEFGLITNATESDRGAYITKSLTWMMTGLGLLAVGLAVFLCVYISKLIASPLSRLEAAAEQLALGDVSVAVTYNSKDELGNLSQAFGRMAAGIREQAQALLRIAEGDYTANIEMRSDHDDVNRAIKTMLDNNNKLIASIRSSSQQVATASKQMSDGSQNLASGAAQQAATIEEFSASITEVQNQSEETTRMAQEAYQDVRRSGELMQASMDSMDRMTEAMRQIDDSSQNIAKIIKVIDDIAFQTNILALNAAVEAARAGQYGKGFAVVAEEVRNLASKSAEAAKETSALIETSTHKVSEGNNIVAATNTSLKAVAEIAGKTAISMGSIQEASRRQSHSITEITGGVTQLSSVVQDNSATAEQAAASAQEMSAQAELLNSIVDQFKLRADVGDYDNLPGDSRGDFPRPSYPSGHPGVPAGSLGRDDYHFSEDSSDKYSF